MYHILDELRDIIQNACGDQFKQYYIGKIDFPVKQYLPMLCIHGLETVLAAPLTTAKDKWEMSIQIDIYENVYNYVKTSGLDQEMIIQTQKAIYDKMEKRTDSIPDSNSVLGAIRRINLLRGTTFLFTNDIRISYTEEQIEGAAYYKGSMVLNAVTRYATRS